jgi:hypothetical protein
MQLSSWTLAATLVPPLVYTLPTITTFGLISHMVVNIVGHQNNTQQTCKNLPLCLSSLEIR